MNRRRYLGATVAVMAGIAGCSGSESGGSGGSGNGDGGGGGGSSEGGSGDGGSSGSSSETSTSMDSTSTDSGSSTTTETSTTEETSTDTETETQTETETETETESSSSSSDVAEVTVSYGGEWSGNVGNSSSQRSVDGSGDETFEVDVDPNYDVVSVVFQKQDDSSDTLSTEITYDGDVIGEASTDAEYGTVSATGQIGGF